MNRTSIPWVTGPDGARGFTWNPFAGCSPVSPGCAHCYAARLAGTRLAHLPAYAGLVSRKREVETRVRRYPGRNIGATGSLRAKLKLVESLGHWTGEMRVFPGKLVEPRRRRKPAGIFLGDMGDVALLTNEEIAAILGVMAACPQHRFYVLTKRGRRMREWFAWVDRMATTCNAGRGMPTTAFVVCHAQRLGMGAVDLDEVLARSPWPLPNVWLGVTVEDQQRADERIPELLRTPAAVRFLSCEPLLEQVDLRHALGPQGGQAGHCVDIDGGWWHDPGACKGAPDNCTGHCCSRGVDWVIVGGESGVHARPCRVEWIRSIVRQCREAGIPVFTKQLGANCVDRNDAGFEGGEGEWPMGTRTSGSERYQGAPTTVLLRARAGADPAEWPEDLRVHEMPVPHA